MTLQRRAGRPASAKARETLYAPWRTAGRTRAKRLSAGDRVPAETSAAADAVEQQVANLAAQVCGLAQRDWAQAPDIAGVCGRTPSRGLRIAQAPDRAQRQKKLSPSARAYLQISHLPIH